MQTIEEEINNGNKIIGNFIGLDADWNIELELLKSNCSCVQFHSSWNWLMPVVEKIEALENRRWGFTMDPFGVQVIDYSLEHQPVMIEIVRDDMQPRLTLLYDATVAFIMMHEQYYQRLTANS